MNDRQNRARVVATGPAAEVLIRPARVSDLDGMVRVVGAQDRVEARLRAVDRDEDGMLVAVAPEGIVGVGSVRWRDGCDAPNPWLYGLVVVEAARGRGIGRALVDAIEAMARGRGARAMSLDVDRDDPFAAAFYRRLGYVAVCDHDHHWRSIDPHTGAVTAFGIAATRIMRKHLR
jgi:GNAT superfamily N-acetyltransferase